MVRWLVFIFLVISPVLAEATGSPFTQDSFEAEQKRSDDTRLVDGLRRRRLFDVAEHYCRSELAKPGTDPTTQATLVIELMKTQTAHAILSDAVDRGPIWEEVRKTSESFLVSNPQHPRKFLIRVQQALSHIAHAKLLRQEIAAEIATASAREKALEQVRIARSLLSELQREIAKAPPGKPEGHELTVEQLLSLNNNVRYQLAVCNLNRAQLYEASDRLNRIDALNGVDARLNEVQRETSEGQPLWWKTKLGQIECLRLLGKPEDARSLADTLRRDKAPLAIQYLLLEQKIRLAIDLEDEKYAQAVLTAMDKLDSRTASLELAVVELAVSLAVRANTDDRKKEWLTFAAQASQTIEKIRGPYWGRRADLILINGTGMTASGTPDKRPVVQVPHQGPANPNVKPELDLLIRLADEAFRKERFDDALTAYQRASAAALAGDDKTTALRLDVRAAQALEKMGKHELAAMTLINGADRDRTNELAAAAHLRGCWNYANSLSNDHPDRAEVFKEHLISHLRGWPNSPTANQIRIWLGHQLQSEQAWQSALNTYVKVSADSPFLQTAISQSLLCATNVLNKIRRSDSENQPNATRSVAAKIIDKLDGQQQSLQSSDPVIPYIELARIELDLVFGSNRPNPSVVNRLLVIESENTTLANRATALRIVSQLPPSDGDSQQALKKIEADERSLDLCERCLKSVVDFSDLKKSDLQTAHSIRLMTAEQALATPELSKPERASRRTTWLLRKSEALTMLDRHAEAATVLSELEKSFPRNAGIQMQLARAITNQFGKTEPDKPLAKWRKIASRLKSHTPNWYEAKYQVAVLLKESGNKEEAVKLLKYLQAIPPGWDQSKLKSEFEQLLREASSPKN